MDLLSKNNVLPNIYKPKGLNLVNEKLRQDQMSDQERIDYEANRKAISNSLGVIESAFYDSRKEAEEKLLPLIEAANPKAEDQQKQKEEALKRSEELEKIIEEMPKIKIKRIDFC